MWILIFHLTLKRHMYQHELDSLELTKKSAADLLSRVPQIISLPKLWLMGTHNLLRLHALSGYPQPTYTGNSTARWTRIQC